LLVLAIGLTSSGCSDPLAYRIVNLTNQTLATWGFHEPCDQRISYRNDYEPEQLVAPHRTLLYEESWGGSDTRCIQVIDEDRELIFAAAYEYERTYIVESLDKVGPRIPHRAVLPAQPWVDGIRESVVEEPLQMTFLIAMGLLSLPLVALYLFALLLVPKAVYLGLRSIYRGLRASYTS
jgi:hypothetical protein